MCAHDRNLRKDSVSLTCVHQCSFYIHTYIHVFMKWLCIAGSNFQKHKADMMALLSGQRTQPMSPISVDVGGVSGGMSGGVSGGMSGGVSSGGSVGGSAAGMSGSSSSMTTRTYTSHSGSPSGTLSPKGVIIGEIVLYQVHQNHGTLLD